MHVHGGTTSATATPSGQTFALDLSTNWTTEAPTFVGLADGFQDYMFASTLTSDGNTWYHFSNQIAYKYYLNNNTWTSIGSANITNPVHGLSAATDAVTGLLYIVNGNKVNETVWMQQYNTLVNSITSVSTHPNLANVVSFAASWSTVRKSLLVHAGSTVNTNVIQRSLYEYVPNVGGGQWTILSDNGDVPPPRKSHCMVPAYNGTKMVVFGGLDQTGAALNDIYTLDLKTLRWTKGTDGGAGVARGSTACAVTNDLFVAWAGCDSRGAPLTSNLTIVYNMKTGQWQNTFTPVQDPDYPNPPTSDSGSNNGAVIGGAIGGVVFLAVAGTLGFLFYKKKRRQQVPKASTNKDAGAEEGAHLQPQQSNSHQLEPLIGSPLSITTGGTLAATSGEIGGGQKWGSAPSSPQSYTGERSPTFSDVEADHLGHKPTIYRPNALPPARNPQAITTNWQTGDLNSARNPQSIPQPQSTQQGHY
ncbi:hypothetical protein B0O80DRAFT_495156 [Mortierella sp. GBAus27b]|nr:hypothetical protein BGX31_006541 [Mortierella sp. GBA43]KAI8359644.1 hypothetical protein B0O80DRAFT_495156 [Mortierella sp. GBAus27b]